MAHLEPRCAVRYWDARFAHIWVLQVVDELEMIDALSLRSGLRLALGLRCRLVLCWTRLLADYRGSLDE